MAVCRSIAQAQAFLDWIPWPGLAFKPELNRQLQTLVTRYSASIHTRWHCIIQAQIRHQRQTETREKKPVMAPQLDR